MSVIKNLATLKLSKFVLYQRDIINTSYQGTFGSMFLVQNEIRYMWSEISFIWNDYCFIYNSN